MTARVVYGKLSATVHNSKWTSSNRTFAESCRSMCATRGENVPYAPDNDLADAQYVVSLIDDGAVAKQLDKPTKSAPGLVY